jgi:hypothetical protein
LIDRGGYFSFSINTGGLALGGTGLYISQLFLNFFKKFYSIIYFILSFKFLYFFFLYFNFFLLYYLFYHLNFYFYIIFFTLIFLFFSFLLYYNLNFTYRRNSFYTITSSNSFSSKWKKIQIFLDWYYIFNYF